MLRVTLAMTLCLAIVLLTLSSTAPVAGSCKAIECRVVPAGTGDGGAGTGSRGEYSQADAKCYSWKQNNARNLYSSAISGGILTKDFDAGGMDIMIPQYRDIPAWCTTKLCVNVSPVESQMSAAATYAQRTGDGNVPKHVCAELLPPPSAP